MQFLILLFGLAQSQSDIIDQNIRKSCYKQLRKASKVVADMGSINPHSPARTAQSSSQNQDNSPQNASSTANFKHVHHQYVLELRHRQIILDYRNKIKLTIGDIDGFPAGGYEGLHLWDSNIILARFIVSNQQIWKGKDIIQMLSGTGIASIALRKFTEANKIVATDRTPEVLQNIAKNIQKNNIAPTNLTLLCIPWSSNQPQYKQKFDYIIGADLLFKGCPIQFMIYSLIKLLKVGGKAYIIVPQYNQGHKKGHFHDSSRQFIEKLDYQIFSLKKEKLTNEIYMQSPLLNQVLGYQQFQIISDGTFYLYTLQKIKDKQNLKEPILFEISHIHRTHSSDKNFLKENVENSKVENEKKDVKQKQEEIQIKQDHIDEEEKRKQLQIVTLSIKQDRPEYERKKRKTITEIIAESEQQKHKLKKLENQQKMVAEQKKEMLQQQKKKDQQIKSTEKEYEDVEIVQKQHQLYEQPSRKSQKQNRSQQCKDSNKEEPILQRKSNNDNKSNKSNGKQTIQLQMRLTIPESGKNQIQIEH